MITIYGQRDTKWGNDQMGKSGLKLKDYGCLCTSIAMLDGRTPKEVNALFSKAGAYNSNGILSHEIASKTLGIEYNGFGTSPEYFPIIAEVDMSPSPGKQQHFVVQINDKEIVDPWTGTVRPIKTYPIISYRKYKNLQDYQAINTNMKIPSKLQEEIKKYQDITKTSHKFGEKLEEKDLNELKDLMSVMRNQRNEFFDNFSKLTDYLKKVEEDYNKRVADLKIAHEKDIQDKLKKFYEVSGQRDVLLFEKETLQKENKILKETQSGEEEEIERLNALLEKNAKDTSILDALSFLLKSILNR